jgi:hypothetical protein
MKTLIRVVIALFVVTSLGCGATSDGRSWNLDECPNGCEEEVEQPLLEATFVSGHLGNYRDCDHEGYTEGETASSGSAEPDSDAAAGACAPGSDCDAIANCEDGQLTVQIANTGETDARGIQVSTLELFNSEGTSRAELPLIEVIDTTTNEAFDGTLAAGETLNVRVVFLGPDNPYEFLDTSDSASGDRGPGLSGTLEVSFTAENHGKFKVESGALYAVPSIDT